MMIDWIKKLKDLNLGHISEFIPQTGLDSISWIEFLKQAGIILKTSGDPHGQKKWREEIQGNLPPTWAANVLPGFLPEAKWGQLTAPERNFWGEQVIDLYFRSILQWHKTNMDFRAERFSFSTGMEPPKAHWNLSRFFVQYSPEFSENVALLYRGHYEHRPKDFRQALVNLGLLGQEQDSDEIQKIIEGYIGEASDRVVEHRLEHFRKSFKDLFNYLRKHRKKIPANFVWLGLCLAGLHETLESLNCACSMRAVYRKVIGDKGHA